jgi:hypothetical protein
MLPARTDRDEVEEFYVLESQRAYQRKRSGPDCLLATPNLANAAG